MISDLKIVLEKISNIFFTKRCEFCGEVIEFDKTVCPDCENLPVNKPPYCIYCGVSKEKCNCDKHKSEYKQIVAPYLYQDNVKRAVLNFKSALICLFFQNALHVIWQNVFKKIILCNLI